MANQELLCGGIYCVCIFTEIIIFHCVKSIAGISIWRIGLKYKDGNGVLIQVTVIFFDRIGSHLYIEGAVDRMRVTRWLYPAMLYADFHPVFFVSVVDNSQLKRHAGNHNQGCGDGGRGVTQYKRP